MEDEGLPKAHVAARRIKEIYPQVHVRPLAGDVTYQVGLGVFRWADVVLGGLDSREARWFVNRACFAVGIPFIDGAIEELRGTARVFMPPDGACYECTMSEKDWELLAHRRSCNLLKREEMEEGRVPTTPTVASVIGAIQCQEAVKYLHGLNVLAGKGFVFDGISHNSYVVEYQRNPDCMSHTPPKEIVEVPRKSSQITLGELLHHASEDLGNGCQLQLNHDIVSEFKCVECGYDRRPFKPLESIRRSEATCPRCQRIMAADHFHLITGEEDFLDRTLSEIGLPPFDVVTASREGEERHYLVAGDEEEAMGELAEPVANAELPR